MQWLIVFGITCFIGSVISDRIKEKKKKKSVKKNM